MVTKVEVMYGKVLDGDGVPEDVTMVIDFKNPTLGEISLMTFIKSSCLPQEPTVSVEES